ncbi:MAG: hypothetical protein R2766_06565 [Saprospiraceae bacterium]
MRRFLELIIIWNPPITDKLGNRNLSSSSTRDLAQSRVELEYL